MAARLGRRRAGYSGTGCPFCGIPLRHDTLTSGAQLCPKCGKIFESVLFHPVGMRVSVPELAGLGVEGGAPCAKHARNQAVAACEHCGKFMCELCKIAADGKVFCPPCFERLSAEGALASTVTRFKNYEGMALVCILLCFLFPIVSIVGAPLGVYYCIRGLREMGRRGETEGRGSLIVRLVILLFLCLLPVLMILAIAGAFQ